MHIICLTPIEEGVYNDHASDNITFPPDGWAYIPEDFQLPSTFPRLGSLQAKELTYTREVEVEHGVTEKREYTMMTVTAMTEGTLPEPEPVDPMPTMDERVTALEESNAEMTEALDMILSGVTE